MPVVEQLDPYGQFIVYRLFREYTRNIRGKIVKVNSVQLALWWGNTAN